MCSAGRIRLSEPWRFLHRSLGEFLAALHIAESDSGARLGEALTRWKSTGSGEPASPDEGARWAEIVSLYCDLAPDPAAVLGDLRERDPRTAVRTLRLV